MVLDSNDDDGPRKQYVALAVSQLMLCLAAGLHALLELKSVAKVGDWLLVVCCPTYCIAVLNRNSAVSLAWPHSPTTLSASLVDLVQPSNMLAGRC